MSEVPLYRACSRMGTCAALGSYIAGVPRSYETATPPSTTEPMHGPSAGCYGLAVSYKRGTPAGLVPEAYDLPKGGACLIREQSLYRGTSSIRKGPPH